MDRSLKKSLVKDCVFILKRAVGVGDGEEGEGLTKQVTGTHFEVHLKPTCIHNAEQEVL